MWMDLRDYHTEWRKSEKQISQIIIYAYMWNLEKWYKWSYLQSRNRGTNVERKYMDTKGEKCGDELGDLDLHTLSILCIK